MADADNYGSVERLYRSAACDLQPNITFQDVASGFCGHFQEIKSCCRLKKFGFKISVCAFFALN